MTELIFEGDWHPDEIEQAIAQLKKSLSMGDSGLDELTPPSIEDDWLTKRQKRLHQLLQQASKQAIAAAEPEEEDSDPPNWDEYKPLKKSFQPRFKRQPDGDILYLNRNNRWAKWTGEVPEIPQMPASDFEFPVVEGEFGRGVYLPVAQPSGGLRLRVHLELPPGSLISDDQFYELEDDLAGNTELLLDGQNIRAIAQMDAERISLLCVRYVDDLEILGILGGSGSAPTGAYEFRIVELDRGESALVLDVEMASLAAPLEKSATKDRRTTLASTTHLNGTKLLPVHRPALNRFLVKQAVARCETDGAPFDHVQVCLVRGVPDFLDPSVYAFCLPQDGRVCLVPHDPHEAIANLCKRLSMRLRAAVKAGAVAGDEALQILQNASQLSPDWWLEMVIKRYVGAILAAQAGDIMQADSPVWSAYVQLLAGRGVAYWGDRRAIAECIAEDYRCAHDPAGLPNLVTLEWDLQVPALARAGQQAVMQVLNAYELWGDRLVKAAVGDTKTKNGKTYFFNENHRWALQRSEGDKKPAKAKQVKQPSEPKPKKSKKQAEPVFNADSGAVKSKDRVDKGKQAKQSSNPAEAAKSKLKPKNSKEKLQPKQVEPEQPQPTEEQQPTGAGFKQAKPYNPHAIADITTEAFSSFIQDRELVRQQDNPTEPWNQSIEAYVALNSSEFSASFLKRRYKDEIINAIATGYIPNDQALSAVKLSKGQLKKLEANRSEMAQVRSRIERIQRAIDHPLVSDEEAKGYQPLLSREAAANYVKGSYTGTLSFYHGNSAGVIQSMATEGIQPDRNNRGIFGKGAYFATSKEVADHYSKASMDLHRQDGGVIEIQAKVKNPLVISSTDLHQNIGFKIEGTNYDQSEAVDSTAIQEYIKAMGHDAIYLNDFGYLITFDQRQTVVVDKEDFKTGSDRVNQIQVLQTTDAERDLGQKAKSFQALK